MQCYVLKRVINYENLAPRRRSDQRLKSIGWHHLFGVKSSETYFLGVGGRVQKTRQAVTDPDFFPVQTTVKCTWSPCAICSPRVTSPNLTTSSSNQSGSREVTPVGGAVPWVTGSPNYVNPDKTDIRDEKFLQLWRMVCRFASPDNAPELAQTNSVNMAHVLHVHVMYLT